MRAVAAIAAALAFVGLVDGSAALSRGIVLDHSIGPVSVLETRAAVERVLGAGRPGKLHPRQHSATVRYPKAGLLVGYSSQATMDRVHERVVFAITTSRIYRTAGGVGVGSSGKAVSAIRGMTCFGGTRPYACQHGMAPGKTGTAFAFRNGRVWRVTIGVSGIFG